MTFSKGTEESPNPNWGCAGIICLVLICSFVLQLFCDIWGVPRATIDQQNRPMANKGASISFSSFRRRPPSTKQDKCSTTLCLPRICPQISQLSPSSGSQCRTWSCLQNVLRISPIISCVGPLALTGFFAGCMSSSGSTMLVSSPRWLKNLDLSFRPQTRSNHVIELPTTINTKKSFKPNAAFWLHFGSLGYLGAPF